MKKVKRVKIKFKLKRGLLALFGVFLIIATIYLLGNKTINNIYVVNNKLLSEQEIITLSGINLYPKYNQISKRRIVNNLLKSPFIKEAKVKKTLLSLTIEVIEYSALCYQEYDENILLSSGKSIYVDDKILGLPILSNQIEMIYLNEFINKMLIIDDDIMSKVSEITYDPNNLDKERFLLYMNDQNYVYLTLSKYEYLNNYNELLPKLEGKKGILYLDSGNHFEIKKKVNSGY